MLELHYTNHFKRDLKKSKKRGKEIGKLDVVVDSLLQEIPLPPKYRNHPLSGEYRDHWECHVEPDWLLIYLKSKTTLTLVRIGTHSDLF